MRYCVWNAASSVTVDDILVYVETLDASMNPPLANYGIDFPVFVKKMTDLGVVLLALDDEDRIAGMFAFYCYDESQNGFCTWFGVRSDCRDRGVGTTLREECFRILKARGRRYFRIRTSTASLIASLTKRYGAVVESRETVAGVEKSMMLIDLDAVELGEPKATFETSEP